MLEIAPRNAAIVEWVCLSISLIFVFLRSYVRISLFRSFTPSDCLILFSWIFFLGNTVCDVYIDRWGEWSNKLHFQKDAWPDFEGVIKDEDQIVRMLKLQYGQNLMYYLVIYFVKAAFLLLYFKLFPPGRRKLRRALHFVTFFTGAGLFVTILINLLWCQPVSGNWTRTPAKRCLAYASEIPYLITNVFHLFSDLMIYILPFFLIPTLAGTATRRSVCILSAIFSLGLLCIVCTVARMICVGTQSALPLVGAWSAAEMGIGIIVACSPVLKTGWDVHRGSGFSYSDDGDDGPNGRLRSHTRGTLSRRDTLLTAGTITALGKRSRSRRSRTGDVELGSTVGMVDGNGNDALQSPGLFEPRDGESGEFSTHVIELSGLTAPRKQSKPDVPGIGTVRSHGNSTAAAAVEAMLGEEEKENALSPSTSLLPSRSTSFISKDARALAFPTPPASVVTAPTNTAPAHSVSRMMWKKKEESAKPAQPDGNRDRGDGKPEEASKSGHKKTKSKPKPKLKAPAFGLSTFGGAAEVEQSRVSATYSIANVSRESRVGDDWGIDPHETIASSTSSGVHIQSPPAPRSRSPFGS